MEDDPYKVLGVERTCTDSDVKKAYRALSRTTHPDKGGSDAAFQRVTQAYERIKTADARQAHDQRQTLHRLFHDGVQDPTMLFVNSMFFGARPAAPTRAPGPVCEITFAESYAGCKRRVRRALPCPACVDGVTELGLRCARCLGATQQEHLSVMAVPRGVRDGDIVRTLETEAMIRVRPCPHGWTRSGDNLVAPEQSVACEHLLSCAPLTVTFVDGLPLTVAMGQSAGFVAMQRGFVRASQRGFSARGVTVIPVRVRPPTVALRSWARGAVGRVRAAERTCEALSPEESADEDHAPQCAHQ
jgi:hypothetical protein